MKAMLEACLEKEEANLEEIEVVVERQKVLNEEAAMETIGALMDRYGDRHLAVGCRRNLKKRTQGDGGSRQKLAAAPGRLTRRVVPALRKGRSRKGPGKTHDNGSIGRSRRQLRLESKKILHETLRQTSKS
jgi:hypothetical protein